VSRVMEGDLVIIGAGTAGSYLGWRLGQRGHRVYLVEKQKAGEPGSHIGIFHVDEIRFAQFGIPLPEGDELIGYYPEGRAWASGWRRSPDSALPLLCHGDAPFYQEVAKLCHRSRRPDSF